MKYNPEYVIKIFTQQNWRDRERAIREISKFKSILKEYCEAALENKLRRWRKTTKGKLALILIYDQVPRIIFEESDSRTYSTDKLAREITSEMLNTREYEKLSPIEIMFAFLPYHHSENLEHQKIANKIFKKLYEKDPKTFEWIYRASNKYMKIIEKFGRFLHRGRVLRRRNSKNISE